MSKETKIIIGGLVLVVLILGGAYVWGAKSKQQNTGPVDQKILVRQDSHKTGSGTVTIVEFGDYQCPPCKTAHGIIKQLSSEYSGKITFVFRNFPLSIHANSNEAALAAEAASTQGKFWEMYDKLYETQTEWSDTANPLDTFVSYAQTIGLDTNKFKQDIENKTYQNRIDQDKQDGTSVGVEGTPTIFLNGSPVSDYSYPNMKSLIEKTIQK